VSVKTEPARRSSPTEPSDFSAIYRAEVAAITRYFSRRERDPQYVADLASETFAEAIASFEGYDPAKGPPRPWLFAIAQAVYARHRQRIARGDELVVALAHRVELDEDAIEELAARVDDQAAGRELMLRWARLPELERQAIELVDLEGLTPTQAADSLGVSAGALRIRLFRARTRLRKETR
jgi:RNA polymerase sigma-70 factor (ECF subfamily)